MVEIRPLASGSGGNAYFINDDFSPLLLEAGIPWREIQRRLGFRTSELAGVLCSHLHKDHSKGIADAVKAGIDCFMSEETAQSLELAGHRVKIVKPLKQIKVGSWTVLPFPVEHDCEGALGYLLQSGSGGKVLYLTDTFYCRYKFTGVTHWIVEVNYDMQTLNENIESGVTPAEMKPRLLRSHFSLENAVEFFKANDLSKTEAIYVVHISETNANAERIKTTLQRATGLPAYLFLRGVNF